MLREADVCEDLPEAGVARNLLSQFNELSSNQEPEYTPSGISSKVRAQTLCSYQI